MKIESTSTHLGPILERELESQTSFLRLRGTQSPLALAYFLSQNSSKVIHNLPHLVIVESDQDAERFRLLIEAFDPLRHCPRLPGFDVSPYSGLYPNPEVIAERLRFLEAAFTSRPGDLFVTSLPGLLQKTLPLSIYKNSRHVWKKGDEIPSEPAEFLSSLGYQASPLVENRGHFAQRGGLLDLWPPFHAQPVRVELFGDQIESLRSFNPVDQRSLKEIDSLHVNPAREILFLDSNEEQMIDRFRADLKDRRVPLADSEEFLRALTQKHPLPGSEFLLPFFYEELASPLSYFPQGVNLWKVNPDALTRAADDLLQEWGSDQKSSPQAVIHPPLQKLLDSPESLLGSFSSGRVYELSLLDEMAGEGPGPRSVTYRSSPMNEFIALAQAQTVGSDAWLSVLGQKIRQWRDGGYRIFIAHRNQASLERLAALLARMDLQPRRAGDEDYLWDEWLQEQDRDPRLITLLPRPLPESARLQDENLIFLRDADFFGAKEKRRASSSTEDFQNQARRLSFGDLKPGDLVVHVLHGIGRYEGLKIMSISGVDNEFIQVSYKDQDRLYLPVYRVGQLQKYSGSATTTVLDKLGGQGWEKTKSKVRAHLRDLASDLLNLYAKRAEAHRPPFQFEEEALRRFEAGFPYEETEDQLRAIEDIRRDLEGTKPMDRLICGDVGFGKTEVAMRAAYFAIKNRVQVALLAPTTVLTFQHFETFKKRFQGLETRIRVLNRFVPHAEAKKILSEVREGQIDILIGTHRLLGKDVQFKNLGLLMIDEEQKFGVAHKEKIRKLKFNVDTLALSATPIPRTLNMSLVGIRDLSLINTPPVDRLPTRTFICKWEDETIRKALLSEVARGGQVYFIHNRIQSLPALVDDLRRIVPELRLRMAHGQMPEEELEKTMLAFFNHEIDVLVCTAIVESGMDVPLANTMFIDRADLFGVSQLYQLRGRVGRSKLRAYCYLMLPKSKKLDPDAQERLRIIQENTALGSGLRIAQYDLELRGAGTLLGEEQSGHVDSVGYELYMDLLKEALSEARGEKPEDLELDPEINLKIQALIPDSYIQDVRIRLSYYKALAEIRSEDDLSRIEEELKDQFGAIPEPVVNLMGLMLIRRQCKDLGVRDISAGLKTISLVFTDKTRMKPETVIQLALRENKKFSITPDQRLNIRMNTITWTAVYEELRQLLKLI